MTTYETRLLALLEAVQDIARPPEDARAVNAALPALFLFTDPLRTPKPEHIAAHMPAGSGIIYRHFGAHNRLKVAQTLREIAIKRQLHLLIGEDDALAESVGADGVHLREKSLTRAHGLRAAHPEWSITGACHDLSVAKSLAGLSALFVSPVFTSQSPSAQGRAALGVEGLRTFVASTPLPVYGLGGITTDTLPQLTGTAIAGIGAVEAFLP